MDDSKNSLVQRKVKRIVLATRIIIAVMALAIVISLVGMYLSKGDIKHIFSICLYICLGLFAAIILIAIAIVLIFIKKNSEGNQ